MCTHGGTAQETDALRQILANFRDNRPDIQVVLVEPPEDKYNEQVQAAVYDASIVGGLPCLLEFDGPNTYNYVWTGKFKPSETI
jgi:multiple sugar transport system substrate-binding protein